jgi:hypothetical protein
MKSVIVNVDFWWVVVAIMLILFHGEPDIIDCLVFKLSGIWQHSSGILGTAG